MDADFSCVGITQYCTIFYWHQHYLFCATSNMLVHCITVHRLHTFCLNVVYENNVVHADNSVLYF
uniref:Uncharacterized protein n=1 Tax=Arundo donax TaxID=35708 RepID=A0A0A9FTU1_ARUDO